MTDQFTDLIGPLARAFFGAPNPHLSTATELRFGTNGSLSVDLKKGTWYDHETKTGGGWSDLVKRQHGFTTMAQVMEFLVAQGYIQPRPKTNGGQHPKGGLGKQVGSFDYTDEASVVLFQVVKFDPKTFRQRRPDGNGGWINNLDGVRLVLYRLPELIEALADNKRIYIVEGEKDVHSLWDRGQPATCNPMGAGKWREIYNPTLQGADVVIIADNDPQSKNKQTGELLFHPDGRPVRPGQDHAQAVAASLTGTAARVRVLEIGTYWPACPDKGDVTDFFEAGHTVEELNEIVDRLPDWTPDAPPSKSQFQLSGQFIRDFVPPDYLLDGILQMRFCYAITGRTGSGKTAIMLLLAACVALGEPIGSREVTQGHVIYFAGENPDDVRMRWIVLSGHMGFDVDTIPVTFVAGTIKLSQIKAYAKELEGCGNVALVIIDTSAVFFEEKDMNDNAQAIAHARLLRGLVANVPGNPCVVALCHPPKNAAADNLIPYGGGAFINEIDGNLTCWSENNVAEVSWQGKFRGADFPTLGFELTAETDDRLRDKKGRKILAIVARYLTQAQEEQLSDAARDRENRLMIELSKNGNASYVELAQACQWTYRDGSPNKSMVHRLFVKLANDKLVRKERNKYVFTELGKKALAEISKTSGGSGPKPASQAKPAPKGPELKLDPVGPADADAVCAHCHRNGLDEDIFKIRNAGVIGSKPEPLHWNCATTYFESLMR